MDRRVERRRHLARRPDLAPPDGFATWKIYNRRLLALHRVATSLLAARDETVTIKLLLEETRTLLDADVANNTMNWQWVAGVGTDAAPYFRVFNPVTQGKKFDPDGTYVRRWVPELADVGGAAVHEPWRLPEDERARLRYPAPLLDLGEGLARFRQARGRD